MTGAFDKLARPVQKWVRGQGWRELRDIQARAVHAIADSDGDVIVSATTAGGKTEAAFLPLISGVLDAPDVSPGFDLVYVGPLRALISDQARRLEEICAETGLPVVPWHGDISASIKTRALRAPGGILLITPESLEALLVRRGTEIGRLFGATRAIVIDELHSVLDSERGVQLRSLLARLEIALNRSIRRIGLSATLGDLGLACRYLRPDTAAEVTVIEAAGGSAELQIQLRGYLSGDQDQDTPSATDAIATHLFERLRGSDNLVFAGSRQNVEIYADRLREMCERKALPQEFYPHHASLSRDHRSFVEQRLKDKRTPTTAVCTSTLELGIDIGDVACVAQIGAPFNVAGLRQRLGRSGRREGTPAILRQYAVETRLDAKSNFADRLRLGLVRAIAMIELLLDGWCEPPADGALHLSTLVHQVLAVIAERGGASAGRLFRILCQDGPFRQVDAALFASLLRAIGPDGAALIEQADGGLLLLGPVGEKIVEHYSFYAVFPTAEEYRLVAAGKELGTLPVDNILSPGMMVIFSGRRWLVRAVHAEDRVIEVGPAKAGTPPRFGGAPGIIHDLVVDRMFSILEGDDLPLYLDGSARDFLAEAREGFRRLTLDRGNIIQEGEKTWVLATRVGTIRTTTLALALQGFGFNVETHDGFLEVVLGETVPDLPATLTALANGEPVDLFAGDPNLVFEKYHRFLTKDLLRVDALSSRLAAESVPETCARILSVPSA
ncbi:MAG: DEAD/DEAH box helicase [Maritimibacter sp.]|nr:DEAD/DEAH box helicase [Maritimibacter sp.]